MSRIARIVLENIPYPVRACIVEHAWQYAWSSASTHVGLTANPGFLDLSAWQAEYTQQRWSDVLETGVEQEAFGRRLQEASRRGRPLGGSEFAGELEKLTGRELRPQPVGRPRKQPSGEGGQSRIRITRK
jgi:putative transposase